MLESVSLTDFRRHESIQVEFSSGVNILAGASKAGKSTIIRGIKWVAFNKPTGDSILRWGTDSARAKLVVDGHKVVRKRGIGSNIYKLDGGVYKSFGQDVPEDIVRLLNVSLDLNFSGQHSSPFLFSLTPGEAARELNAVVNLDRIDEVLGNLASEVRKTKSEISVCEDRLKQAEDRARSTDWVEAANTALKEVEAAEALVQSIIRETDSTERLLNRVREATRKSNSMVSDLDEVFDRTEELDGLINRVTDLSEKVHAATDLLSDVNKAQAQSDRARAECLRLETELAGLEKGRCPLCGIMKKEQVDD